MAKSTYMVVILSAALCALPSCASPEIGPGGSYDTIPPEPNRDSEAARELTEEAEEEILAGDYEEAEERLKDALLKDLTYGPAHNSLGAVYYHTGRWYLAAWEFEYAAKLLPDLPQPKNNLGLVFETVGRLDDAVKEYDAARSLAPGEPEILGNLVMGESETRGPGGRDGRAPRGTRHERNSAEVGSLGKREARIDANGNSPGELTRR